ncbi:hypothetical protein [Streptomyces colonosanans]|uniref:hypothetical protein n=1 Tax=Streptomyces colonosanans TaxID=1428652 RepID=UPI0015A6DE98|nr:hypothetical protein [Streptomyces colonosanans]
MSDNCTTLPAPAEAEEAAGHGRHRGEISAQEAESSPSGRHRKPSEEAEQSGITAA